MDEKSTGDILNPKQFRIPAWLTVVLVLGILTLILGIVVGNTSYINFPEDEDDYKDKFENVDYKEYEEAKNSEEDISSMQYLIGAVFIHAGAGLILMFMLLGVVANETIHQKPRIVMLIASTSLLIMWIYFSLLSGLMSRMAWLSP